MKNFKIKNLQLEYFLIALLVVISGSLIFTKPISQDEGVFLTIGKYLREGYFPYSDFFDHKPPAIYYLFSVFNNLFLAKTLLFLVNIGSALLVYATAKILYKNYKIGIYSTLFFLILMIFFEGNFLIAEPFGAFLIILATYIFLSNMKLGPYLIGIIVALALLFKQTFLISIIPFFVVFILNKNFKDATKIAAAYLSTIGLSLLFLDDIGQAYNQIIALNFSSYPKENFLALFNGLKWPFLYTLPILVMAIYSVLARIKSYVISTPHSFLSVISTPRRGWRNLIKKAAENQKISRLHFISLEMTKLFKNDKLLLILSLALLPIPLFFVRHYPHYWIQIIPFIAIWASFAAQRLKPRHLYIVLTVISLITLVKIPEISDNFKKINQQFKVAEYVSEQKDVFILAENQFTSFYYLNNKTPLNKYLYITEINDWSEQAEQKTIKDLENLAPKTIVLWPKDHNFAYAKRLQEYILTHFRPIKEFRELGMVVYTK